MDSLIAAAVAMVDAHTDPFAPQGPREWFYPRPGFDFLVTVNNTADGPVWEVVGYAVDDRKVHRLFAVGNRPFEVHYLAPKQEALVADAICAMATCRPAGVH